MLTEFREKFYEHIIRKSNYPRWRGQRVVKYPNDLMLYAEAIFANKPDWIVEIGTRKGGTTLFFCDMLTLTGGTGVVTIDIVKQWKVDHPLMTYIEGDSIDPKVIDLVKRTVSGKVMVSIDGNHRTHHVKRELKEYQHIVTPGQYMVAEDCFVNGDELYGPGHAVNWFMTKTKRFKLKHPENKYMVGLTVGGWLKCLR